jgi:nitroimidazol reductase NimA-like FMN-containing flavoprotein (pyridoxamine 5'-phosphate oxidase superfamily)
VTEDTALATPDGAWSGDRTEQFLRETTVPVRLSCHRPGGGLWMLSLWYRYDDGRLACSTAADAAIVEFLDADPSLAFEISTNNPPYRGVRGAGTAEIRPSDDKAVLRDLVERYLGGTDNDLADWLLSPDREEVRIDVDVERAYTWDYSDRMDDS